MSAAIKNCSIRTTVETLRVMSASFDMLGGLTGSNGVMATGAFRAGSTSTWRRPDDQGRSLEGRAMQLGKGEGSREL